VSYLIQIPRTIQPQANRYRALSSSPAPACAVLIGCVMAPTVTLALRGVPPHWRTPSLRKGAKVAAKLAA
jgi:hypothetical protein